MVGLLDPHPNPPNHPHPPKIFQTISHKSPKSKLADPHWNHPNPPAHHPNPPNHHFLKASYCCLFCLSQIT